MTNKYRRARSATILALLFFASPSWADAAHRRIGGFHFNAGSYEDPQVPHDAVLIINNDTKEVVFQLRNSGNVWVTYTLGAGAQGTYKIQDANAIRISTDSRTVVTYSLEEMSRYQIVWRASAHRLEVEKIELSQ